MNVDSMWAEFMLHLGSPVMTVGTLDLSGIHLHCLSGKRMARVLCKAMIVSRTCTLHAAD